MFVALGLARLCVRMWWTKTLAEIPCKSPPRTKAQLKIFKKYPSLFNNTMARVDKSLAISKAVLIIYLRKFIDYSLSIRAYKCDYIIIFK